MILCKTFQQGYGLQAWAVTGWYLFGIVPLYVRKVKI